MGAKTVLRGITWNHSRGFVSVVATAQRFCEIHPQVDIVWEKRSLQEFADAPIQGLAEEFDLLVIDHPWAGYAAHSQALLPLQELIPAEYLRNQAAHTVGRSHASYIFDGNQCALAIDAATPVASYRADLLERYGLEQPRTWRDLLALARQGRVIMPGIPIDTLMNFYMLCATQGEPPFVDDEWAVSDDMSLLALEQLRELARLCPKDIFDWNPIAVYEALSRRDDFVYCPFAYGYSNYARAGYSDNLLTFDDMVDIDGQGRCQSTLGGTGLAISSRCQAPDAARDYAMLTAGADMQRTLFFESGGQPGHRSAWEDAEVNRRSNDYFRNTLPALDRAYLRPRFPGYLHFQDHAGAPIRDYLMRGGGGLQVLAELKRLFEEAKTLYAE
ncbi:MAG: extracellular solute-binding protein [Chloroflexota bacterium]|nr:extracellular solute-binding protein [Chloroflexota bacterium]MDE2909196.1 extracellular solute-binding protein [Chloroflexota bacterium]